MHSLRNCGHDGVIEDFAMIMWRFALGLPAFKLHAELTHSLAWPANHPTYDWS